MDNHNENGVIVNGYIKNNNIVLPIELQEIQKKHLRVYVSRNNIQIEEGQMFLAVRTLCEINASDVLLTKANSEIYIKEFTPYFTKNLGLIPEGYTGGIICNIVDEEFLAGEIIHVQKNQVN